MKIVFVATVGGTHYGLLAGQARAFRARGWDVWLVSTGDQKLFEAANREGVRAYPVKMTRGMAPLSDIIALIKLTLFFWRVRPSVLHASTPKAALLATISGAMAGVPLRVFLARGSITGARRGVGSLVLRYAEWLTVLFSHEVVVVSPSLMTHLRSQKILPNHKGVVLGQGMSNGLSNALIRAGEGSCGSRAGPVVGYLGRLGIEKGICELASCWTKLKQKNSQYRLLIVGDWDPFCGIPNSVREELESDPHVTFVGHVDDVAKYLCEMRVLAFPSHREGFPNAIMEAAAFGVPAVGSKAVGVVDAIVDGVTGSVVDIRSAEQFSQEVARYLDSSEYTKQRGGAAKRRAARLFRATDIWSEWERFLLQQYARRRGGRPSMAGRDEGEN